MKTLTASLAAMALLCAMAIPAPASSPALSAAGGFDRAALNAIIEKLGDPIFAVREDAQKRLEGIPLNQRDALDKRAQDATDAETKSRLLQQVGLMDERIATDPPPISLELKDASAAQVAEALSKAMGVRFKANNDINTFSLSVSDQPYWEVMRNLYGQHPIWPAEGNTLSPASWARTQIVRGIAISTTRAMAPAGAGAVSIGLSVALDPRIVVIKLAAPIMTSATDEEGHIQAAFMESPPFRLVSGHATLVPPPHFSEAMVTVSVAGGKTLTIKGSVELEVQTQGTTIQIADAGKHVNDAIPLGDNVVTLRDFIHGAPDAHATSVGIALQMVPKDSTKRPADVPKIELTGGGMTVRGGLVMAGDSTLIIDRDGSNGGVFAGLPDNGLFVHIQVTDAQGHAVGDYLVPQGVAVTSVHLVDADFKEPLKFTLTLPTRTRKLTVPFEFKDIPIER